MALPGTSITAAYVASDGQSIHLFASPVGFPNTPAAILTVPTNPTFTLNGAPVVVEGPWGHGPRCPFTTYRFPTPILPTDKVDFTAPAGWLTTAQGPAQAILSRTTFNSTGQSEPAVYGFLPFDLPATQRTLKVGVNWAWPTSGANSLYNITANWMKRANNPWTGALTSTPDGRPLTFKGSMWTPIAWTAAPNAVDASLSPTPTGTWTFIADEADPLNPLIPYLSANPNGMITASPVGTAPDGGKVWQFLVQKVPGASKTNLLLSLNVKTNQAGIVPYTLSNECLFSPVETAAWAASGNLPSRIDPNRPDETVTQWLTTPSGKCAAVIRQMDSSLATGGLSNVVDASDLASEGAYTWAGDAPDLIDITEVRTYALPGNVFPMAWGVLWTSPDVLLNAPVTATYHPADPAWLSWSGTATQSYVAEYKTATPHGLKAGQRLVYVSGAATFKVSNGSALPIDTGPGGLVDVPVFPTMPDRFVAPVWHGAIAQSSGSIYPGGLNQAIGATAVDYRFKRVIPDAGVTPPEVAARAMSSFAGTEAWANIPMGATDACSAEQARRWRDNLTPGGKLHVEYSNEVWNFGQPKTFVSAMRMLGVYGTIPGAWMEPYTHIAAHHHDIWFDVFEEQGRGSEIIRTFNVQCIAGGPAQWVVNEANRYNATNPPRPIPIDELGVAPYLFVPSEMMMAVASLSSNNPLSIAYQKPTTWTRKAILDWFRHYLKYTVLHNGPAGSLPVLKNILRTYKPVGSQPAGFVPKLIGYEGGIQGLVGGRLATGPDVNGCYLQAQLTADLDGDPKIAECQEVFFQMCQQGGMDSIALYSMCQPRWGNGVDAGTNVWGLVQYPGQQPGPGTSNKFWSDDGAFHPFNESPRLMVARDWIESTSPGAIVPPPPPVTPTIVWNTPLAIMVGTPLGATQLNAAVVGGISGSFAYTPPAGSVLAAGSQVLSTLFTPTNHIKYTTATASVILDVFAPITPTITWHYPADITVGTMLTSVQLNATADVPGVFTYTPDAGTVLDLGSYILSVHFQPLDYVHYVATDATVQINVVLPPLKPISDAQRRQMADWLMGK